MVDEPSSSIRKFRGERGWEIRWVGKVLLDTISRNNINRVIVSKLSKALQCGGSTGEGDAINIENCRASEHLVLKIHIIRCDRETISSAVLSSRAANLCNRVHELLSDKDGRPSVQFHVINRHTLIAGVMSLEPDQCGADFLCIDGEQVLQLMWPRGVRCRTSPDDTNMIWKRGWWQRKDIEQLCGVLRNNDSMSLDSKVCCIHTSRFLKTDNAGCHMTPSDD